MFTMWKNLEFSENYFYSGTFYGIYIVMKFY